MKKYLSIILSILKYLVIYFMTQIIGGMILGIGIVMKYHNTLSKTQVQEMIGKNIGICTALSSIVALFIYFLILKNKEENLWTRCEFKKISLKNSLLIICSAIGLAMISCSFILLTHNVFKSYDEVSKNIGMSMNSVIGIFCMVILIPIFEEILFRGLIFKELKKNLNLVGSIILQALIFGLCHGNILQGIYAFALGVIAALVYTYTKSICSNILLHSTFNLMAGLIVPICLHYTQKYVWIYCFVGVIILVLSSILLYKNKHNESKSVIEAI